LGARAAAWRGGDSWRQPVRGADSCRQRPTEALAHAATRARTVRHAVAAPRALASQESGVRGQPRHCSAAQRPVPPTSSRAVPERLLRCSAPPRLAVALFNHASSPPASCPVASVTTPTPATTSSLAARPKGDARSAAGRAAPLPPQRTQAHEFIQSQNMRWQPRVSRIPCMRVVAACRPPRGRPFIVRRSRTPLRTGLKLVPAHAQ
jgi:hypothetical protein